MKLGCDILFLWFSDQEDIRKMLENCLKGGTPAAVKSGKKAAKGSKNGEASGEKILFRKYFFEFAIEKGL